MSISSAISDDPFIRRTLQTLIVLISAAMAIIPTFVAMAAVRPEWLPAFAEGILDNWFGNKLFTRADIVALAVGAAPLLVRGVCYAPGGRKLNFAGRIVCGIALIGGACSLVALQYLKAKINVGGEEEPLSAAPLLDGPLGVLGSLQVHQNLAQMVDVALSVYVFYLALFFGFSSEAKA